MNRIYIILIIQSLIFGTTSLIDSDGDGYYDVYEIQENTNPNDSYDKIYIGDWPYNSNKSNITSLSSNCPNGIGCDCLNDSDCINSNCAKQFKGSFCTLKEGDVFPEFISIDQFGDLLNIYDFANQGKYILLELGATWCGPCNTLAAYFAYNEEDITRSKIWKPEYNQIYDLVHNEEVYFMTILYEDEFRDNASDYTVEEWYNNYPDDSIPILADKSKYLHGIVKPTGIPTILLLDENMRIVTYANRGFNASFDRLINLLKTNDDSLKK